MPVFPDKQELSRLSISALKTLIETTAPDDNLIDFLANDPRAGVRALARKLENRKHRADCLLRRQEELAFMEKNIYAIGKKFIAGLDEAGRGPLAGPVVAAAVILPEEVQFPGLDDSKKLTAKKRDELFDQITSEAVAWGIGMVDNDEIDSTNILDAAMKAMRIAVQNMKMVPDIALVDGTRSPGLVCEERLIVDGDARCRSIAAASVIAKVTRDRIMIDMDGMFPGYGFSRNKGYGSGEHITALRKLGPCDIHRFSFKIVPQVSPPGATADVLKKKLVNASNPTAFDRTANIIARIRGHISDRHIMELREVYRSCRQKMKYDGMTIGARGEEASCNYLKNKGYSILDRNWRVDRYGYEIDIIARIDQTVVFCEVKTAKSNNFGPSISWVTPEKIEHISRAASEYIATKNMSGYSYRFDVIGLQVKGKNFEITHIENAFTMPEEG